MNFNHNKKISSTQRAILVFDLWVPGFSNILNPNENCFVISYKLYISKFKHFIFMRVLFMKYDKEQN